MSFKLTTRDKFMAKVHLPFAYTQDCWPWAGYVNPLNGYGQMSTNIDKDSRVTTAPRVALFLFHGTPEIGRDVARHSCDNRLCVSPYHLSWGSYSDNMQDRLERSPGTWGEQHQNARLTDEELVAAVGRVKSGESAMSVAADYGISNSVLSKWVKGEGRGRSYLEVCRSEMP